MNNAGAMQVDPSPTEEGISPTSPAAPLSPTEVSNSSPTTPPVNWEKWERFMYNALVLPYASYTKTATFPPEQTRPFLPRAPGAQIIEGQVEWAKVQAHMTRHIFGQDGFLAADTVLLFVDNRLMEGIGWWLPVARLAQERTAFKKHENWHVDFA